MKFFAKRKLYLLIFLILLIILTACSKESTEKKTTTSSTRTIKDLAKDKAEENKAQILNSMHQLAENSHFSGAVLEQRNGKIAAVMYYGYKNKEKNEKVDAETIFPICSQSKIFCGVIIAQLIREQKLSYEDIAVPI